MPLKITNDCIACDACINECPTDAIKESDPIYIINPKLCVECIDFYEEPQCVLVCSVDAIIFDIRFKILSKVNEIGKNDCNN